MIFGSVIVVFSALVQIETSILQGIGRLYSVMFYSVLGLIMKYIVNYILIAIPSVNIYGAIIGSAVGFGVPIVLNIRYILKTLKIKINFKSYISKPLISSMFMAALVYVIYTILSLTFGLIFKGYLNNAISALLAIALGMLAYLYAMVRCKGITNNEFDIVLSRIKRIIPILGR